jgi:outer membrane biosynthesis protein TonB
MQVIQIPPPPPPPPEAPEQRELFEARHWETAYRRFDPDDVPHLLIQLQDDLARTRQREALWLSVILHFLIIILLWNSEKLLSFLPHRAYVVTALPTQQKDATYLALPPDEQKVTRRPDSKIISDKDRIATSKTPQLNRKELKKILDSSRPGRPGESTPQSPAVAQAQPQPQPSPQQNSQQNPNSGVTPPAQNNQAQLQMPALGGRKSQSAPSFTTPMTAGSMIDQAARASAANRGRYGGEGGDYGLSQGRSPQVLGPMEVLTDTMGVDFGPYLQQVLQEVKGNWYRLIPESAMPPIMKKGKLAIHFVILKNGKVSGMVLDATSSDVALDRAAWGAITASNPFPPLPREFPGQDLGLRFYFYYNPDKAELQ